MCFGRWYVRGRYYTLVDKLQAKQTLTYKLEKGYNYSQSDLESFVQYLWEITPPRKADLLKMDSSKFWLVCREDELDEEVNEFGVVSP